MNGLPVNGATWGAWWWPWWICCGTALFLGPEVYALCTNSANTLSAWVWRVLQITRNESPAQWTAVDFLTFGVWAVMVVWLTWHFWGGRFT